MNKYNLYTKIAKIGEIMLAVFVITWIIGIWNADFREFSESIKCFSWMILAMGYKGKADTLERICLEKKKLKDFR